VTKVFANHKENFAIIFSDLLGGKKFLSGDTTEGLFVDCDEQYVFDYRGADKSLARPERKQAQKLVRDARDFNNMETRAGIRFFFLQSKAPKEIHAILTETLACFLPGRAKGLSAPL